MLLHRYWFSLGNTPKCNPLGFGCGITAFTHQDAVEILHSKVFAKLEGQAPTIDYVIEDLDVGDLDQGHVIPNMGMVLVRGVWFPLGY